MSKLVYLAGPISGLNYGGATDWRQYTIAEFKKTKDIVGVSPMRGKDDLSDEEDLDAMGYVGSMLASPQSITARDRFDCQRCDVLLVNLSGAEKISIGTMIELGWADSKRIPIILVMKQDNIHNHCMVNTMASYIVETLEEAVYITKLLLIEGN